MHHWSYGFCGYVHFLSIVQHVPHGQASPQEAKGDAEFAATIQSNLAAAYAKKGDHNNALAAAEEVRSAWCFLQIFFVFYLRYLSLIRGCPLQATQIHTNSWNLSMNIGQCHTLAHRNQQLSTTRFEAIRLRPDWAKAHSRKALSLLERSGNLRSQVISSIPKSEQLIPLWTFWDHLPDYNPILPVPFFAGKWGKWLRPENVNAIGLSTGWR